MTTTPPDTPTPDQLLDRIDAALERLAQLVEAEGRDDLVARVDGARARLDRPTTVVCVVGEFKQGKSSLVNALVGADVCPVDDDLATSVITLVRHGEVPRAVVRRRVEGDAAAEAVAVSELRKFVSEAGNPANEQRVDRVDVMLPAPLLRDGMALADTPGTGGIRAGHGAATLAFLPFADGLIFVSDATSELTRPELDFLVEARERCPNVMLALSKIDMAAHWRRIADLNRGHLARLGLDIPLVPVSSVLHRAGADGGIDTLITALHDRIVTPARTGSAQRIAAEVESLVGSLVGSLAQRRAVLDDSSSITTLEARVAEAMQRIEHLRGPGARWSITLGDRVGDLSNDAAFTFRGDLRDLTRNHEESIENLKTSEQWEQQAELLQRDLAAVVTRLFGLIEEGRQRIRAELVEMLAAEEVSLGGAEGLRLRELDVSALWRGKPLDTSKGAGKAVATGLTGLRGAQSGIMLFGMAGQFLPAATATMLVSNPVLLAAGAVFGGYQLIEDRKRKVATRRQLARTQLRQFVDDVQFQVTNDLGSLVRTVQRDFRDEFGALLLELQRSWAESLQQAKAGLSRSTEERAADLARIDKVTNELRGVHRVVEQCVAGLAQQVPS